MNGIMSVGACHCTPNHFIDGIILVWGSTGVLSIVYYFLESDGWLGGWVAFKKKFFLPRFRNINQHYITLILS